MGESRKNVIDMTKSRSERRMIGFDIEQWRGEHKLSKYEAQTALGFRNSNHYNKMCGVEELPPTIELLIRLYDEKPIPEKYTLRELFELMYADALKPFMGTALETFAKVDLGSRFTKMFGRSPERRYQWLEEQKTKNSGDVSAYSDVDRVLSKLKDFEDPKEVLERLAKRVWALRGVDLDIEMPIPTLRNPPQRKKTGRKGRPAEEVLEEKRAKEEARQEKAKIRAQKLAEKVKAKKARERLRAKKEALRQKKAALRAERLAARAQAAAGKPRASRKPKADKSATVKRASPVRKLSTGKQVVKRAPAKKLTRTPVSGMAKAKGPKPVKAPRARANAQAS
jgi:hypothetical protein